MKVAMIGLGKLGLPCAEVMAEHYDVTGYDINLVDPTMTVAIKSSVAEAVAGRDLIFVAVPTPHDRAYGGETPIADLAPKDFDYSIVQQVLTVNSGAPVWQTPTTGTVTSVSATVPAFLSISGSPITTSGTLTIGLSGTALPVANGGSGVTTSTGTGSNVLSNGATLTGNLKIVN
jgi:hypothetical protein